MIKLLGGKRAELVSSTKFILVFGPSISEIIHSRGMTFCV